MSGVEDDVEGLLLGAVVLTVDDGLRDDVLPDAVLDISLFSESGFSVSPMLPDVSSEFVLLEDMDEV